MRLPNIVKSFQDAKKQEMPEITAFSLAQSQCPRTEQMLGRPLADDRRLASILDSSWTPRGHRRTALRLYVFEEFGRAAEI